LIPFYRQQEHFLQYHKVDGGFAVHRDSWSISSFVDYPWYHSVPPRRPETGDLATQIPPIPPRTLGPCPATLPVLKRLSDLAPYLSVLGGARIGVLSQLADGGLLADYLVRTLPELEMLLVFDDLEDPQLRHMTWARLHKHERVYVFDMDSSQALAAIPDGSVDFVYSGVWCPLETPLELQKLWPKLRPGGFVSGQSVFDPMLRDNPQRASVTSFPLPDIVATVESFCSREEARCQPLVPYINHGAAAPGEDAWYMMKPCAASDTPTTFPVVGRRAGLPSTVSLLNIRAPLPSSLVAPLPADQARPLPVLPVLHNRWELGALAHKLGFKKGAEIGVADGEFSAQLLRMWSTVEEFACVDLFAPLDDMDHNGDLIQQQTLEEFDEMEAKARQTLAPWIERGKVKIMKQDSLSAADNFADGSLDFVYIDASHDYISVRHVRAHRNTAQHERTHNIAHATRTKCDTCTAWPRLALPCPALRCAAGLCASVPPSRRHAPQQ